MNQLQAMRAFIRVVDLASFNLAARQLGMSAAAVTRSIGTLEAHLNVRLLNRTTRSLSLTEVGKEYLEGCREVVEKLDEIESNLVHTTRDPSGTLRIASTMTFSTTGLATLLASYRAQHPRVSFDVTTFDTDIDMIDGRFDVCFSDDRSLSSSTLVSRTLTSIDDLVVASPVYLARRGTPRDLSALGGHELLAISDGLSRTWEFVNADGIQRVSAGNTFMATSHPMARAAALNHMGLALLPRPLIADDLAQGTLVPVLEQFAVNGGSHHISIVYPGRNYLSMKVRSFIDFVVGQYRSTDIPVALRAVA